MIENTGNTYKGTSIEDISEGGIGLLVYTGSQIERGSKVRLYVKLSKSEDPIVILGEIANCARHNQFLRGYRIGIRFTNIKAQDLKKITAYIAENRD